MQAVGERVGVAAGRRSWNLPASLLCLLLTQVLSLASDISPSPKQSPSGC